MDAWTATWTNLPEDAPMALLRRRRIIGQHAMVSEIRLAKGCDVPTHSHPNEQFAMVVSGRMRFGIGAEGSPDRREIVIGAGDVLVLPGGVPHSAHALEDSLIYDVFSPPSEKTGIDRD